MDTPLATVGHGEQDTEVKHPESAVFPTQLPLQRCCCAPHMPPPEPVLEDEEDDPAPTPVDEEDEVLEALDVPTFPPPPFIPPAPLMPPKPPSPSTNPVLDAFAQPPTTQSPNETAIKPRTFMLTKNLRTSDLRSFLAPGKALLPRYHDAS